MPLLQAFYYNISQRYTVLVYITFKLTYIINIYNYINLLIYILIIDIICIPSLANIHNSLCPYIIMGAS